MKILIAEDEQRAREGLCELTHSSQTKKGIKCTHYHIFVTRIGFRLEQGIEIVPSKL